MGARAGVQTRQRAPSVKKVITQNDDHYEDTDVVIIWTDTRSCSQTLALYRSLCNAVAY